MSRNDLIELLTVAPREIDAAEAELLAVEARRRSLAASIEKQEAELLLSGTVAGKNEATRHITVGLVKPTYTKGSRTNKLSMGTRDVIS